MIRRAKDAISFAGMGIALAAAPWLRRPIFEALSVEEKRLRLLTVLPSGWRVEITRSSVRVIGPGGEEPFEDVLALAIGSPSDQIDAAYGAWARGDVVL